MLSDQRIIKLSDHTPKDEEDLPAIFFDEQTGFLRITGQAYHEKTAQIFSLLFLRLNKFLDKNQTPKLLVNIDMLYFNTSAKRNFHELFQLLEKYYQAGGEVFVYWYYNLENYSIFDSGVDFRFQVTFSFLCLPHKINERLDK